MTSTTHDRAAFRAQGDDAANWPHTGERPTGCLSDMHSIAFEPLTEAEMRDFRKASREVRAFEGLAVEIMRTQMTLAIMPPRDDPEALSLGTEGHEELRLAAALTRCVADNDDNLAAMLAAALETDCMRLGLAGLGGRTDVPDA